jgi:thiol-disulfide isomerase/thioredoxin
MIATVMALAIGSLILLEHFHTHEHEHDHGDSPGLVSSDDLIGKKVKVYGPTLEGDVFRASSLRSKVVMVNFWATWCGPCLVELPSIVKLRNSFSRDEFEVVGVNLDQDPPSDVPPAIKRYKIEFPVILDPEHRLTDFFGIEGIPVTVFIDQKGTVLHIEKGDRNWASDEVVEQIKLWMNPTAG